MAMDYESVSKQILDKVGGSGNIASAEHCMTRLRLILNDESKADDEAVKAIKGVKSVIKQGNRAASIRSSSEMRWAASSRYSRKWQASRAMPPQLPPKPKAQSSRESSDSLQAL